jgi:RNA polymerase sigma-70 factor (ECF subfamily)
MKEAPLPFEQPDGQEGYAADQTRYGEQERYTADQNRYTEEEGYAGQEDYAVVQLAQNGDRKAFNELVVQYQNTIVSLCTHLMRNRTEGEDAAQDTFIKAFRRIGSFRGEARFSTWLYAIAVNVCRNKQRSFWQRLFMQSVSTGMPDVDRDLTETIEILDSTPWPSEQLERKELRDQIKRVLVQMPTRYRELIVLRDIKELSYSEIAGILGVPLGTVKSGLARARLAMQVELKGLIDGI